MFRPFIIIILINTVLVPVAGGQDLSGTLKYAEYLETSGDFTNAVKVYQRVAFFADDSLNSYIFPRIAKIYFDLEEYEKSIYYTDLALNTTQNDSLIVEYNFHQVLCYYLLSQHDYALQQLYIIDPETNQLVNRRYHFYHALISMKKGDADQSLIHLLAMTNDPAVQASLIQLFGSTRFDRPNPGTARFLSILVPGLGQLYAGDYRNAANSFLLNATLAALAVFIAYSYSPLDALVGIVPWLQRYYMGGFTRAKLIAVQRQAKKREQLLENALKLIEPQVASQ